MQPDLEKLLAADERARALVDRAQEEARSVVSEAEARVLAMHQELEDEIARIRQAAQDEISGQAEARAAEILATVDRYVQGLRERQQARREEAVTLLAAKVLAG